MFINPFSFYSIYLILSDIVYGFKSLKGHNFPWSSATLTKFCNGPLFLCIEINMRATNITVNVKLAEVEYIVSKHFKMYLGL